ncbi:MAG: leucine-rich repeat domain-containing protein [Aureispira sp.]
MYYLLKRSSLVLHLFVVIFLWNAPELTAQTTAIPDTVFEKKLIFLGIDSDGLVNGQILNSDAAGVTKLFFQRDTIRSLEGIEAFVNLDTLQIFQTHLDSLTITNHAALKYVDVVENPLLKYLNLSQNPLLYSVAYVMNDSLDYVNSSDNPSLINLSLSRNALDSLKMSNLPALISLDCPENNLSRLDLAGSPLLEWLDCDYNRRLNVLDISNNTALRHVDVEGNGLTDLSVTHLPGLIFLNCSNNRIINLDLSSNINLIQLRAGYCSLQTLDLSNNPRLTDLECESNDLRTLDFSNNLDLRSIICYSNQLFQLDVSNLPLLKEVLCYENQLARLVLGDTTVRMVSCSYNPQYLKICVPDSSAAASKDGLLSGGTWHKDPWAIYTENCPSSIVEGRIAMDSNNNCLVDSTESGLKNQLIQFEDQNNQFFYANTVDTNGNYVVYLDTGLYTVSIPTSSSYWQGCPSTQTIYVDTNYVVQRLDWSIQAVVNCPLLTVDIGAPFLRKTGGGSVYTITYSNQGTVPALGAYVEVELDTFLNVISTSLPIISQVGTIYRFNIGNVAIGAAGAFNMQVLVDTSALLAQTHCTEARIYPDSLCLPNPWTGADIHVVGQCTGDSVLFTLQNVGNSMAQPLDYFIVEDNIMMRQGNFNLNTGSTIQIREAAKAGRTYRIWAKQENGYPLLLGYPFATIAIEGCVLDSLGGFNTGFILPYDNNNGSPFVAVDCQESIAAYDPNDKAAQPAGYGVPHYIYDYTTLDYKIRFQNTGNDTAFTVVIRDTLSAHLDPTTLVMGTSSHVYTWNLSAQGILEVRFESILLVDSLTNEPASHGFFKYTIQQQPNNPLGTVINNTAAIYFDYNPPIFTNTTYHTVGDNFIPRFLAVGRLSNQPAAIQVFPNPFTQQTTLEIVGDPYDKLVLEVVDVAGRVVVQQMAQQSNQLMLQRRHLLPGLYFYRLIGDGELIGTGKLQVR